MESTESLIQKIHAAFDGNEFPGERWLQGSYEGSEPYEEVGPFEEQRDWRTIDPAFLDAHYSALSYFSEAGFRYFLPAFLIADVQGKLETAEPLFHLISGFYDFTVEMPTSRGTFELKSGGSELVNPRRYGAMTSFDYARYRLSIFTREEASAIVAYLRFKQEHDDEGFDQPRIQSALDLFWLDREKNAPPSGRLEKHLADQAAYLAAVRADHPEFNIGPDGKPVSSPGGL